MTVESFLRGSADRLLTEARARGIALTEREANFLACAGLLAGEQAGLLELSSEECRDRVLTAARYCAARCS